MSFINDNNPAAVNARNWNWRIGDASLAPAAPIDLRTFFGIDGNGDQGSPLGFVTGGTPFLGANSDAQFLTFESYVVFTRSGFIATQNFEGIATGTTAPLVFNLNPGGLGNIQCTLNGVGIIINIPVNTTDNFGRWNIPTQTETQIWFAVAENVSQFSIEFDQDVNGFGFYGTDIGDFGGTLRMDFQNSLGQSLVIKTIDALSLPANARDGNCCFFGAASNAPTASNKFRKIVFNLTGVLTPDGFGFDRFTVARIP